ncbi:hypothetical protein CCACVL1_19997 [Corchorus capsularis]|uniref:Uncharacterized protein n=1 Tax=Corchorus capsularis TaxID=210143 RepID=A0A1R3HD73_COCAP|nr:hypothetical protein CCACVL1_19997 [Corchorus capsularis]
MGRTGGDFIGEGTRDRKPPPELCGPTVPRP